MSTGMPEVAAAPAASMPLPRRVISVFTSPKSLFESLRDRPVWLDVLLIYIVATIAIYAAIGPVVQKEQLTMARERIEGNSNIPADQKARILERQEQMMSGPGYTAIAYGSIVLFTPVVYLLCALLLMLFFGFGAGGRITFKQAFAASNHLGLIYLLGGLVKLPLILAKKTIYVATSLALIQGTPDPQSVGYAALDTFDIFNFWALGALIVGMPVMAKISPRKAQTAAVLLFVLVLLLRVVGAVIGAKLQHLGG